jgi:VanZ family protein
MARAATSRYPGRSRSSWVFARTPATRSASGAVFVAGALAVLAANRRTMWPAAAVWAWSVTVEALQTVVTETRSAQWSDVAANTVGVWLGAAATWWWMRRRRAANAFT